MHILDACLYELVRILNGEDKPFISDPNEHQILCAAKKQWETVLIFPRNGR